MADHGALIRAKSARLVQRLFRHLPFGTQDGVKPGRELLRKTWRAAEQGEFQAWWRDRLREGLLVGTTALPPIRSRRPPLPAPAKCGYALRQVAGPCVRPRGARWT